MDNNSPSGNGNDNHDPFENGQQYDNPFPEQNMSGSPPINNQNIPNNNCISPQNNYNAPFNGQYVNAPAKKNSKALYIMLIAVLICFAVIIFLLFTIILSMLDGGNKKTDDNNITISENSATTGIQPQATAATTGIQTQATVTTNTSVEEVTGIVTVAVEVTEPKFNPYTYTVNNYNLPIYANAEYTSDIMGHITDRGNYTVTDQSGRWANLNAGGWINLDDAETAGYMRYLGQGYISTKNDPLNMRYAPESNSKVLAEIPRNTSVEVYETYFSDWYYTSYNGKSGFVSSKYVTMGALPKVTIGSYYGFGTVATEKDPLSLRSEPSTGASIVASIPKGTGIYLYTTSEYGWYYTTYNEKSGFVSSDYISFAPVYEYYAPLTAVINTKNAPLNLRSLPSTDSSVITSIPKGTTVTVIEYYTDWCYIEWGDYRGYASTGYLAF